MWLYVPSISAQATADSSSPSDSQGSTPELFVTLSGKPTQRPYSWRGWKTRPWIGRLSGTISQPLTAQRGAAEWISSLPVSPAPTFLPLESDKAQPVSTGYGRTSRESFEKSHREWCCSKTCPALSRGVASEAVAYVAGLVDGEGSITIQRNEHRGTPQYALCLAIEMDVAKSAAALNVCRATFGGRISVNRQGRNDGVHAATAAWRLHGSAAACALDYMSPVLRSKHRQAKVAIGLFQEEAQLPSMANGKRRWTEDRLTVWRGVYERMAQLNARGDQPLLDGAVAILVGDRWMCRTESNLFEAARWETFSGRLPSSGSMRNGVVSQRQALAPRTGGNGSGLWPTATATDSERRGVLNPDEPNKTLNHAAQAWPTPTARDGKGKPGENAQFQNLTTSASTWPTPTATEAKRGDCPSQRARNTPGLAIEASRHDPAIMTDGDGGSKRAGLNPCFVEALMGLPIGWTDPVRSLTDYISQVTDSSRSARPKRYDNSSGECRE